VAWTSLYKWGGWDVFKCVYANIWIFSPQNTMLCTAILLDRINLKNFSPHPPTHTHTHPWIENTDHFRSCYKAHKGSNTMLLMCVCLNYWTNTNFATAQHVYLWERQTVAILSSPLGMSSVIPAVTCSSEPGGLQSEVLDHCYGD